MPTILLFGLIAVVLIAPQALLVEWGLVLVFGTNVPLPILLSAGCLLLDVAARRRNWSPARWVVGGAGIAAGALTLSLPLHWLLLGVSTGGPFAADFLAPLTYPAVLTSGATFVAAFLAAVTMGAVLRGRAARAEPVPS